MSQLLMQDELSAPENHMKDKEFEGLFRDYMHHHHHDTIPSFTQNNPALEAAPTDIPPAFEKVSPSS